jgi:hypothetical protein
MPKRTCVGYLRVIGRFFAGCLAKPRSSYKPLRSKRTSRSRPKPYPIRELRQNRFLFWRFDGSPSGLSNVQNRIRRRHALRYPVGCCERSGSAGSAFAVNDHLRSGRRLVNEFRELLKLIQCRRTEVPHGDVVPHVTQSGSTCDIVARCSLLLANQRNEHSKAIASQPFKIGVGRISAAQQTGFVNPPCIHRRFCVSGFRV